MSYGILITSLKDRQKEIQIIKPQIGGGTIVFNQVSFANTVFLKHCSPFPFINF